MSKTVTLRLSETLYHIFQKCAEADNRPLSNFIETAAKRFIEESETTDEYETSEIRKNEALNRSLLKAHKDAKLKKGRFVG